MDQQLKRHRLKVFLSFYLLLLHRRNLARSYIDGNHPGEKKIDMGYKRKN